MTIQNINIGTAANDHTGDTLRVAMGKVNSNFAAVAPLDGGVPFTGPVTAPSFTATGNLTVGLTADTPTKHQLAFLAYDSTAGYARIVMNNNGSAYVGVGLNGADFTIGTTTALGVGWSARHLTVSQSTGSVAAGADNAQSLGTSSIRWSTIYAGTGTINTSDAREKTPVTALTDAEVAAAKDLARELGTYQFLTAVAEKGDAARLHIGMTVQRAIEIMQGHGLDPMRYGFICHDVWADEFVDHPAVEAQPEILAAPAEYQAHTVVEQAIVDGEEVSIERQVLACIKAAVAYRPAVEAKAAWREQTQTAGDRYAFRTDELLLFIAQGFDARLTALEEK